MLGKWRQFYRLCFFAMLQVWCTRWRTSQNQRAFSSLVLQRLAPVVQPVCARPPSAPHLLHLQITQLLILAHQASSTAWMTRWTSVHRGAYVTQVRSSCFDYNLNNNSHSHWKLSLKTKFWQQVIQIHTTFTVTQSSSLFSLILCVVYYLL